MRDEEFGALSDWLAEGVEATEGEAVADWQRSVSAARWARLSASPASAAARAASA